MLPAVEITSAAYSWVLWYGLHIESALSSPKVNAYILVNVCPSSVLLYSQYLGPHGDELHGRVRQYRVLLPSLSLISWVILLPRHPTGNVIPVEAVIVTPLSSE